MTDMKIAIWGDYEVAYVRELETKIERLTAENQSLKEQIATCRELRTYDRKEIEQLRYRLTK